MSLYRILPPAAFSLRFSAGPAAWGGGSSPRQAVSEWVYICVEAGRGGAIVRTIRQDADGMVRTTSTGDDASDWFRRIFRPAPEPVRWHDPLIHQMHWRYPGLWSLTDGGLFPGIITSIIGQSISIASAMATQRRLALSFNDGVEVEERHLVPLPTADQLANASVELIRASGVTWKRAEALRHIAREQVSGNLPGGIAAPEEIAGELRRLPLVGPWTAASALLWGLGEPDAFPSGDVALLRAARLAYDDDGMTMKDLDALAEGWRPYRGIATRLLWTALLGPAW